MAGQSAPADRLHHVFLPQCGQLLAQLRFGPAGNFCQAPANLSLADFREYFHNLFQPLPPQ